MTEETRKIYELLKFYKKTGEVINFKYRLSDVIFKGKVNKVTWSYLFPLDPYVIMKSDDENLSKIFLEDIEERTVLPHSFDVKEIKIKQETFEEEREVRKSIPKSLRIELWRNFFGKQYFGRCFVCKNQIRRDNFEAGHVIAVAKDGKNTLDNLRPICSLCNKSMGTDNMEDFRRDQI